MKTIFFMLFFIGVFAYSADLQNKLVITIPNQDSANTNLKIPAMNLQVGESGIITREIENNEFILGVAIVSSIDDGVASVQTMPFDAINELYMPLPLGEITQGDKITFRILYQRGVLLAPNQHTYQEVLLQNSDIDFIHPDIFATFLSQNDIDMPDTHSFKAFCDRFDIGLVFITHGGNTSILDCQSFKILDTKAYLQQDTTTQSPFWTRLGNDTLNRLFDMDKMHDFDSYYTNLIRINNANFMVESTKDLAQSSEETNGN